MSEKNLRAKIIRLAHSKPELRKHLLPLVTKEAVSNEEKREADEAFRYVISGGRGGTSWNIDKRYNVQWKRQGGCILETSIEFVIKGEVSGVQQPRDFRGESFFLVSNNKRSALKECREKAEQELNDSFEEHDVVLDVKTVKGQISFNGELGNGVCHLLIDCTDNID